MKKIIVVIMSLVMVMSYTPLIAFAGNIEPEEAIASEEIGAAEAGEKISAAGTSSGTCGEDLKYTLENGTLTIFGTGDMEDYSFFGSGAPWYEQRSEISEVIIESDVTSIGSYAFNGCNNLTDIKISEDVTSIGESAFFDCKGLKSIKIPDGVTSIDANTFCNCSELTSIELPTGLTSIGRQAFSGCSGLKSIKIPEGVTSIGNVAFSDCSGLTNVEIPDGITTISGGAFGGCSGLKSIKIPEGVTSIDKAAFSECNNLKYIFYNGTEDAWKNISVGEGNEILSTALVHYSASEHKWNNGAITTEPTCTEKGVKEYTCTVEGCDGTKTEEIAASGHDMETVSAKPATFTEDGKTSSLVCKNCGHGSETYSVIPKVSTVKLSATSYVYDGGTKQPSVTLVDSDGNTVSTYTANIPAGRNVGTYKGTITLGGNYSGTTEVVYTINPKGATIKKPSKGSKSFTAKWKAQKSKMPTARVTGYQIQYSQNPSMAGAKVKTVKGYKKTSKKIKKLKKKKTYYVQVRTYMKTAGGTYYSAWSPTKKVKIR